MNKELYDALMQLDQAIKTGAIKDIDEESITWTTIQEQLSKYQRKVQK